jgi:hypothetical protein
MERKEVVVTCCEAILQYFLGGPEGDRKVKKAGSCIEDC